MFYSNSSLFNIIQQAQQTFADAHWQQALSLWEEAEKLSFITADLDTAGQSRMRQVSCLHHLSQINEATQRTVEAVKLFDPTLLKFREAFVDAYGVTHDAEGLKKAYTCGFLYRGICPVDQSAIETFIHCNKISFARKLFKLTYPTLTSASHFNLALRHSAMLYDKTERKPFLEYLLTTAQTCLKNNQTHVMWYRLALSAMFALDKKSEFIDMVAQMRGVLPHEVGPHQNFSDLLVDHSGANNHSFKVFGIGLSKSGTLSLTEGLKLLGFSSAHWVNPYSMNLLTIDDALLFDSLTDISITYHYQNLYKLYPDAYYVYTTRDITSWENSIISHYRRSLNTTNFSELKQLIESNKLVRFGVYFKEIHKKLYTQHRDFITAYRHHETEVRTFFNKHKSAHFIEIDVSEQNALQKLSSFLSTQTTKESFLHTNTKCEKDSWRSPISGTINKVL